MADVNQVSLLLAKLADGDRTVENDLFPLVYDELKRIARAKLRSEPKGHSLQATALVHEVYLRLATRANDVKGRVHFFALAARVMRQVLIDHARAKKAVRRGGLSHKVSLTDAVALSEDHPEQALLLDAALTRLEGFDPKQAEIVELRFYSGLTEEEIALLLGISTRTVKREWRSAKLWLEAELTSGQSERKDDIC
jgi:RNA polymerase sigma factor (TIGR02999 family)